MQEGSLQKRPHHRNEPGAVKRKADGGSLTPVKAGRPPAGDKKGMHEQPVIDPQTTAVLSLPAETQFASHGIVSRTLLQTPTARVVLFGFAEGQELTEHTSTAEALIQILTGRCRFLLDGQPRDLQAGDLLHLPPHLPHAVKATEPFSMLLTLLKPAAQPAAAAGPAKGAA